MRITALLQEEFGLDFDALARTVVTNRFHMRQTLNEQALVVPFMSVYKQSSGKLGSLISSALVEIFKFKIVSEADLKQPKLHKEFEFTTLFFKRRSEACFTCKTNVSLEAYDSDWRSLS